MDKRPLPPWLKQLWDELTIPPAILRNSSTPAATSANARPNAAPREQEAFSDEPSESPTDPDDIQKKPRHSAKQAERLTRQYFTPKRVGKTVSKPRRKLPQKTKHKKKNVYNQADIITAARNSPEAVAPKRTEKAKSHRPDESIISQLSTKIVSTEPKNGIWMLRTDEGKTYALKEAHVPLQRLRWLAEVCDELSHRGFQLVPHFLKTSTGEPFIFDGESLYYAYDWMPGNPLRYESMRQLGDAARSLAKFHMETRQLPPMRITMKPYPLMADVLHKQQELITLSEKLSATTFSDEYDHLFKSQLKSALEQGEGALAILKLPEVEELIQNHDNGLCHLDATAQNLIVHPSGYVQLIDLELMNPAPRVVDLSHLLRRAMQAKGTWSSEIAIIPIVAYNRTEPLRQSEYLLLEALLTFPYRLHRLQKSHYGSSAQDQKTSQTQLQQLKKTILLESERQTFLHSYTRQVTRRMWSTN